MLLGMEEKKTIMSSSSPEERCFACTMGMVLKPSGYKECHTHVCDYCMQDAEHCVQYNVSAKSWMMRYFCLKCQRDVFIKRVRKKPVDK